MNTRNAIVESSSSRTGKFLNVDFNQDYTCFSCSTQNGFMVFNVDPLECKLSKEFSNPNACGIALTRMLYRTNYVALVGGGRKPKVPPNKLVIWDDLQQRESLTLSFMSTVKCVFLSRIHIVVVLENSLEIFEFGASPKRLLAPLDTCAGAAADFVVCQRVTRRGSASEPNVPLTITRGILAFPSARNPGQVQLADLSHLQSSEAQEASAAQLPTSIIKAHNSPIRLIKISPNGAMVATCSMQGTLIRVFSTQNGSLISEFRRGLNRADLYEMAWSSQSSRLAVVSDKQTLHVFQITDDDSDTKNKTHVLKDIPLLWKPKYLSSVWAMCSLHLHSALKGKGTMNDQEFYNDRCKVGWCHDGDDDSLILVWRDSGIWEKYALLEKEPRTYTVSETLQSSPATQQKKEWEIIRESWRKL
ncbi:LAME_0E01574g1_1 [Lachancea meyersii CBS 8951]|uniref:LAME_0E01574g1_1 n=1 Tax=Lachancea meyersii CBS 8951 TaxID=1266667 RepID=A0A1G4JF87_9SACH|nr:LAME_0E01574g1_1 [Lachancea meyersii CBS 8951]